ncbi:MAG: DUF5362 family protein [Acidobacteriota bacterium]|nr:DUF5362 family protein [Acidobacteriota bacterium]
MSDLDQFAPPASNLDAPPVRKSMSGITPEMIESLRKTRPWVLFISIIGFIFAGFLLIMALIVMAVGGIGGFTSELPGLGAFGGILIGLVYAVAALFYIFPSLFLFRYAAAIRRLLNTGSASDMEEALSYQKSFWRLVGIMVLVVFALYALLLGLMFLGAVIGAAGL